MDNQRSPRYPAVNLTDAILATRALWTKERRTPVHGEVLAKAIGYSSNSGPARTLVGAMRQYGLLEKSSGGLRLSDIAMKIVHGTEGSAEQLEAIREAALSPELFRDLNSTHPEASEGAIKSYLILKKGFSEGGAKLAASAYKDTLSLANSASLGYSSSSGSGDPETEMSKTSAIEEPETVGRSFVREIERGASPGDALIRTGQKWGGALLSQALVISIPRNFKVDVNVYGDQIKREDLAKIKSQFTRWIEGLEEAFD